MPGRSTRGRAVGALGMLALGVLAWALAPSQSVAARKSLPRSFAGVNFAFRPAVSPSSAELMAHTGAGTARFGLTWPSVEPKQGTYDWSKADKTIGNLASAGVEPMPVLYGTPRWAAGGVVAPNPVNLPVPTLGPPGHGATAEPPNANHTASSGWTRFIRTAAKRYGPGGSFWTGTYARRHPGARPVPVRVWQIWNEENIPASFWPKPSPPVYAQLLAMSAHAIRAVQPRAKIALGGVSCPVNYGCARYLRDLYAVGGVEKDFDIVAINPYGRGIGAITVPLRRILAIMKAAGDRKAKLWVAEFGWGSGQPNDTGRNVGHKGQARLLTNAFRVLKKRYPSVWRVSWFDWQDGKPDQAACDWCGNAGLIDATGKPKPSWHAFRVASGASG